MLGFLTRVVPHVRDSIRAETKITFTLFTPKWFFPSVSPHMYDKTYSFTNRKLVKAGHTPK